MAAHLLTDHAAARRLFALADSVLGVSLTDACTRGTADELARTEITQPAITATSLAVWHVLRERGYRPHAVAGHSLGEYAALVAAGVLTEESALELVSVRGRLMSEIADQVPGAMAAILGLDASDVARACAQAAAVGLVEVANFNEPGQTVLSGEAAAVAAAGKAALQLGAHRVVGLKVSAPFHCSLMSPIEEEFAAELTRHDFAEPRLPLISSVTGTWVTDGDEARDLLRRQLTGPVQWVEVLRTAERAGTTRCTELGPGRVLSGLVRQTLPEAEARSTGDPRRLAALLADLPVLSARSAA
jgi:[acyl-carrier-protein] S-malonyltransferase